MRIYIVYIMFIYTCIIEIHTPAAVKKQNLSTLTHSWVSVISNAIQKASLSQVQFLQVAKLCFADDGRVQHFEEYWHGKYLG